VDGFLIVTSETSGIHFKKCGETQSPVFLKDMHKKPQSVEISVNLWLKARYVSLLKKRS